jgi:antitoxin component YwqK of YwqJK toxin-antitoxin module
LYEYFYKNDQRHREGDLPAVIIYRVDGSVKYEYFYKNDQRHREGDLPAEIRYRVDGSISYEYFYKNGKEYTPSKPVPCAGKIIEIDGKQFKLIEIS